MTKIFLDNRLTPAEIEEQLLNSKQMLQEKNDELKVLGIRKAEAEKAYRIQLAKKYFELRDKKYPVTLVPDLARGDEDVSELKLKRDISDMLYEACRDKIKDLREEIGIMRSLMTQQRFELENA